MRRVVTRTSLTTVLAAGLLAAAPAPAGATASTPIHCDVASYDGTDKHCIYIAVTTRGHAEATIEDWAELNVRCLVSDSGGWIGYPGGSIDYNQIPGEPCFVDLYVIRGDAKGSAGSVLL